MVAALLLVLVLTLGVAACLGRTADSRDDTYRLRPSPPAPPPADGRRSSAVSVVCGPERP